MKFGLQVLSSLNGFKKNISKIEFSVYILPISNNFLVVKLSVSMIIAIFLESLSSARWASTGWSEFCILDNFPFESELYLVVIGCDISSSCISFAVHYFLPSKTEEI